MTGVDKGKFLKLGNAQERKSPTGTARKNMFPFAQKQQERSYKGSNKVVITMTRFIQIGKFTKAQDFGNMRSRGA
eukprot:1297498-Heterocapsa_arctica.AAC.1